MGWTVLYIAFGVVALWLLGEVLLQYKARLRWRLLAFVGFLGVVAGVLMGSVVVIGLGAAAFAAGQTQVTLSFRRGFSTGWALGGRPGASKRRRIEAGRPDAFREPTLQVSDVEYEGAPPFPAGPPPHQPDMPPHQAGQPPHRPAHPVHEPEPMPDETASYGVYGHDAGPGNPSPAPDTDPYGYPPYGDPGYAPTGPDAPYAPAAAAAWDGSAPHDARGDGYAQGGADYGYDAYPGHDDHQYGYDTGQPYPPYPPDPYAAAYGAAGTAGAGVPGDALGYDAQQQAPSYDPYAGQPGYGYPPGDPYAGQQPYDQTPPGGVWMPQQRATESGYGGDLPPEQQYPYQGGYQQAGPGGYDPANPDPDGTGYDHGPNEQQYRY